MSKRSYPFNGGPSQFTGPSKKKRKGRMLSEQDVLENATFEERFILNQKRTMKTQLSQDLLPEYVDDEETQKEISAARMMDEIYKTCWKRTVTIEQLENNPKDFQKTVMSLDVKIVPKETHYRYVRKENWELRRQNLQVRRQFRHLTVRRYEFLAERNPMSAFNCYPVAFQSWRNFMQNSDMDIDAKKYKDLIDVDECRRFLEKAKEELVTNEVFCALSSLRGTANEPETTPQDKMLFVRLKNKMTSNDLRAKIPKQDPAAKNVVKKTLRENREEEQHSYLPITEKAVRYICEKLNLTVHQLMDSDAEFKSGPKLTPEEEKILEDERRMICGWSYRFISPQGNDTEETQENGRNEVHKVIQIEDEPATVNPNEIVPKTFPTPGTVQIEKMVNDRDMVATQNNIGEEAPEIMEIEDPPAISNQIEIDQNTNSQGVAPIEEMEIEQENAAKETLEIDGIQDESVVNDQNEIAPQPNPNTEAVSHLGNESSSDSESSESSSSSSSSSDSQSDMSTKSESQELLLHADAADVNFNDEEVDELLKITPDEVQHTKADHDYVLQPTTSKQAYPGRKEIVPICKTLAYHGKPIQRFKSSKNFLVVKHNLEDVHDTSSKDLAEVLKNKVLFSTAFYDKAHSPDCKTNCALKFIQQVRRSKCSDVSKPFLQDVTFKQLKRRVNDKLRKGEYKCDFKNNRTKVPTNLQVILTGPTEMGGDRRYYTDKKAAFNKLWALDFFGSIIKSQYCGLDVEGGDKGWQTIHWKNKNKKPFSVVHFMSPNGIHLEIHCLFDGDKFQGCDLNKCEEILNLILLDNDICKIGHGVTGDGLCITNSLKNGTVRNFLEVGRIIRFLHKGEKRTGKIKSSEIAEFTDVYPKKGRVDPSYNQGMPGCYYWCKDPREWYEVQHQYNRIDLGLALYILDVLTLHLCKSWSYEDEGLDDVSVALPRLMGILLLQDLDSYRGKESEKDANNKSSNPSDAPADFLNDFEQNNPFRKMHVSSYYPAPPAIAQRLLDKQYKMNLPFTPVFFRMKMEQLKYFERVLGPVGTWHKRAAELAQNHYTTLYTPHICEKCGDSNHATQDCKEPRENLNCLYPLCPEVAHATRACPMILRRCTNCDLFGHDKSEHDQEDFDIFKAYNTHKSFSFVHPIASMMNHRDLVLITDKEKFRMFTVHPKKGFAGDDASLDVKVMPK